MKPILEIRNIWKKYKVGGQRQRYLSLREQLKNTFKSTPEKETFWALKDITFDVFPGECVGIIGKNGAGKSTLLKILSKITPPTKGHIKSRGRIASLLEVGTGFHPELTGQENIFLNGSILGLRRSEINQKFDEIVDFSGVEQFLETPLKHFSSGMQLRLAFAVAAHLEPEILLIDEVLAVGDAEFQRKCLGKMDEVSKSGRTVIFVSHNMGLVKQLCPRTILFHEGEIQKDTDTRQTVQTYMELIAKESDDFERTTPDETKSAFFKYVKIVNENGNTSEVPHTKPVVLEIKLVIQSLLDGIILTLSLTDRFGNRVFTIDKPLSSLVQKNDTEKVIQFEIPAETIVPSTYSWLMAMHIPGIDTIDVLSDVCQFRIIDFGSEMAFYEDQDYGYFFLKDYEFRILQT